MTSGRHITNCHTHIWSYTQIVVLATERTHKSREQNKCRNIFTHRWRTDFQQGAMKIQVDKDESFQQNDMEQLDIHKQKKILGFIPYT